MTTLYQQLNEHFQKALDSVVGAGESVNPQIFLTSDEKFGDYQSNVAMGLAKALKKKPRDIATEIISHLELDNLCSKIEIAGPGFINIFIKPEALASYLDSLKNDARLGVEKSKKPIHHVIDFSSPNLAKEMHVGHLRTTITGEVIARTIEFMGHTIERVNHVGDWGTQFGMLLQYIYDNHEDVVKNPDSFHVQDLETFYKKAKKKFDEDEAFKENSRQKVVSLQSGDETAKKVWKAFLTESLRHCHEIYGQLNVTLKDVGESFYNDRLAAVVDELEKSCVAVEDQGAVCVFLDGYTNREGNPLPMIIKKKDGGYNYDTTDIAAIKYRIFDQKAQRLIYVTDLRQAKHFEMLFKLSDKMGWSKNVQLDHIGYGMVLGNDRKPFKTRDGDTVRLKDLISESVERAKKVVAERDFSTEKTEAVAKAVGLAAVKYSDLSHNLASDYVFSWDKMLAMDGNTGPYMLYAYARIQSVWRKGGIEIEEVIKNASLKLEHPTEMKLAKELVRFSDVIDEVNRELKPNLLTDYLYALSRAFSSFYDKGQGVAILDAETEIQKNSRLLLCYLTANTLKLGLNLLSIDVVDEM